MLQKRIIPCLTIDNDRLIHVKKFDLNSQRYIGDPVNALRIYNEYEVDELIILDITCSKDNRNINFNYLEKIAAEAFFPLSYGGGINNVKDAEKIINIGFEKIVLNSILHHNIDIVNDCKKSIGAQSITISLDVKSINSKFFLFDHIRQEILNIDIEKFIENLIEIGIGEIILTYVDNDGTMGGINEEVVSYFSKLINVPLIYKGGAKDKSEISKVLNTKAQAFCSSTIFIMKKINGGIVLNYPSGDLKEDLCRSV